MYTQVIQCILFITGVHTIKHKLIIDYLNYKHLRQTVVFTCNYSESVELSRIFMENYISNSIRDIGDVSESIRDASYSIRDITNYTSKVNEYRKNINNLLITDGQCAIIIDGGCASYQNIFNETIHEKNHEKYHYLLFADNQSIFDEINHVNLHINVDLTVAVHSENAQLLFDVYNPSKKHGGSLKVAQIGSWDGTLKLNGFLAQNKYWRRRNMTGCKLKGNLVLINGFWGDLTDYLYNNVSNRNVDTLNRYGFIMWSYIQDYYNYTLELGLSKTWGDRAPNGSYIGLIGQIERNEIDMGLSPVYVKRGRLPIVDYLTQIFKHKLCIIFRHPRADMTIRGAFFEPLSRDVWYGVTAILILTTAVLKMALYVERQIKMAADGADASWNYVFLAIFGGFSQQGVSEVPHNTSGRIAILIFVIFTFMLSEFYSDSIVSSLLTEPPKTINTMRKLADSSLQVSAEDFVYVKEYFNVTTDPEVQYLYNKKIVKPKRGYLSYYEAHAGLDLVKKGGFAFEVDVSTARKIILDTFNSDAICELTEILFKPPHNLMGVTTKNSPFKEAFLFGFQRLGEYGFVKRQKAFWNSHQPECLQTPDASAIYVGMDKFSPALLLLAMGIVLSLIILFVEILTAKYTRENIPFLN